MLLPKVLNGISQVWNQTLYDNGKRSEGEFLIKSLPVQFQEEGFNRLQELSKLEVVAEPFSYYQKRLEFDKFLEKAKGVAQSDKSFIVRGSADMFGYRPSGTKIWSYFANPMGVFGYVSEQHSAVRMSIDIIRQAVEEDGFFLVAAEGVSPKKLQEVYNILTELKLEVLRVEMIAHLQCYGNTWLHPVKNRLGGLQELELMFPPRLLPVFNRQNEKIIEWIYTEGRNQTLYKKDQLMHLMLPSLQNNQIGSPPLVSAITRIETALSAMQLNNTIFQKGGLVGVIVSLEGPKDDGVLTTTNSSNWVREAQAQFDYLANGTKAGQGIIAMPNVKDVHQVTKIGELDANWKTGEQETNKVIAQLLGLPSEKIGVPRSAAIQYQPELVENVVNAQFDSTINRLCRKVDKYLNKYVLKEMLGITDIKIVPAGRYGALTLSAAQTILALAQAGPILTINEAREKILGWEPLPANDPRGKMILDISALRTTGEGDSTVPAMIAPDQQDPELEAKSANWYTNIEQILKDPSVFKMKIGGDIDDDGIFYKGNQKIKF